MPDEVKPASDAATAEPVAEPPTGDTPAADQKPAATTKPEAGLSVDGKPALHIKIYSPFKTFFDEAAFSLSGVNLTGPFDILPRHHNFISLLEPCELSIQAPTGERKIRISGGVMHVKADKVTVLLDA